MAIEEPLFQILDTFESIQIRIYEPLVLAETRVEGHFEEVGNQGFRRVARYIFGGNSQNQKIAMTAPVFQEAASMGAKIAFVMPKGRTLSDLPVPREAEIELIEVPARKMAVIAYSGTWTEKRYQEKLRILLDRLQERNIQVKGQPLWARYNPPWVPWFMRRNEILIEVV